MRYHGHGHYAATLLHVRDTDHRLLPHLPLNAMRSMLLTVLFSTSTALAVPLAPTPRVFHGRLLSVYAQAAAGEGGVQIDLRGFPLGHLHGRARVDNGVVVLDDGLERALARRGVRVSNVEMDGGVIKITVRILAGRSHTLRLLPQGECRVVN